MKASDKEKVVWGNLTVDEIKDLAKFVKENHLSRIKISSDELIIENEKKTVVPPMPFAPAPQMREVQADAEPEKSEPEPEGKIVKSPIVGTFYGSPAPDKDPFVKIGDKVNKGDVIMIIESMKLMNEVQSEYTGVVADILVESGSPVEYGQPIMVIKEEN